MVKKQIVTVYHRHPRHWSDEDDGFGWDELGLLALILLLIWGVYWFCIHWLDHFLGDWLAWYVELLSPIAALPVLWVFNSYGRNPLHWWPMVWGHKVLLEPKNAELVLMDESTVVEHMGGPTRVWCDIQDTNRVYLKFRRKRDAVWFSLFPQFFQKKSKKKK